MATTNRLEGMKVILEPNFVCERHLRTWKKRLWSWPWKPWVKFRTVPSKKIVLFDENTLIMHPQTWEECKKLVKERNGKARQQNNH